MSSEVDKYKNLVTIPKQEKTHKQTNKKNQTTKPEEKHKQWVRVIKPGKWSHNLFTPKLKPPEIKLDFNWKLTIWVQVCYVH